MCGIVGIQSNKEVTSRILNSLKKLEYRGYDSAGIATLNNGFINEVKCEGRVEALEKSILKTNLLGEIGIGHVKPKTLNVLSDQIPRLKKMGYKFEFVSNMLH